MKTTLVTILLLSFSIFVKAQDAFFTQANLFFSQYVANGLVAYQKIKSEPELLNQLVDQIENFSLVNKSDNIKKAFYINAYNILTIQQVVERYPVKGPMQVSGFFDQITHQVAGQKLTLDQLEKGILFKKHPDSRMHFALVCAAKGCPSLANFAFQPSKLDQQLDNITSKALSNDRFVRLDPSKQRIYLSQIFEWYHQDFINNDKDLIGYINQYRQEKISADYKVKYYEYDWSLNES